MSAIIKTASLALLALTVAAKPVWEDCKAGTVFYSCANGYRGCFVSDPCALPPLGVDNTPKPTPTTTTAASCATGTSTALFTPIMYNIYPADPSRAEAPVSHLEVGTSEPAVDQIAVFKNIPANAKLCSIGWVQAAEGERDFVVEKSGLLETIQLTGFPAEGSDISASSIAPFEPEIDPVTGLRSIDFTNWDKVATAATHGGSTFDCAETVYFRLTIAELNGGEGHIYMGQDAKNGLTLTYSC